MKTAFLAIAFLLTTPAANWLIGNVGAVCLPAGPCLIPVWPGLMAPSGVLMIGVAMVLRDALRERVGLPIIFGLICAGVAVSAAIAPVALALASAVAFLLSEVADTAVYEPLRKRHLPAAVIASGVVGALVDSAIFLWLAFGSLHYLQGQVVGKLWASVLAAAVLVFVRRNRQPGERNV